MNRWEIQKNAIGDSFHKHMLSYMYMNSHYCDKTAVKPTYPYGRNSYSWKDGFHIETYPWKLVQNQSEDKIGSMWIISMSNKMPYCTIPQNIEGGGFWTGVVKSL